LVWDFTDSDGLAIDSDATNDPLYQTLVYPVPGTSTVWFHVLVAADIEDGGGGGGVSKKRRIQYVPAVYSTQMVPGVEPTPLPPYSAISKMATNPGNVTAWRCAVGYSSPRKRGVLLDSVTPRRSTWYENPCFSFSFPWKL